MRKRNSLSSEIKDSVIRAFELPADLAYGSVLLSVTGQTDGTLTIVADGEMPERDIPVLIIILG